VNRLIQSVKVKDGDYFPGSTDKGVTVQILDHQNNGRRATGSRRTGGIHKLIKTIEGVEIPSQLSTEASIPQPSFFSPSQSVFVLTGAFPPNC
jgi:hypothetical protein